MEVLDDSTSAYVACLKSKVECTIEIVDRIEAVSLLEHQHVEECYCRLVPSNQMVVRTFLKRINRDFFQEMNVLHILFLPVPLRFLSL